MAAPTRDELRAALTELLDGHHPAATTATLDQVHGARQTVRRGVSIHANRHERIAALASGFAEITEIRPDHEQSNSMRDALARTAAVALAWLDKLGPADEPPF